jgi:DNA-binding CsgD family transcriptional regulator/tetratricopeptide (TPR) repeat protein
LFVGRGEELRRLEEGLTAASDGRAAAFLVAGDAGVGKTRLVAEFMARASRRSAVTLLGNCLDVAEGRLPFGPFSEALRGYLRSATGAQTVAGGEELALLLSQARPANLDGAGRAPAQGMLFESVLGVLGRLASTAPVVLAIEDLHWADRSTRDLLLFLVRNVRSERVQLVVTCRTDELDRGHELRRFLAELTRSRRMERIEVRPFTCAEIAEVIAGILGAPAERRLVESVFARCEGNPFFAEELVAAGVSAGGIPRRLREIVLARADQLSPAAQELLSVVATGGRAVTDQLLAAVWGGQQDTRLTALREAVARQLIVTSGGGYVFRHELLRETVYRELLPEERRRLHAAYGRALDALPEQERDATVAGDLARHWLAAGDVPRALGAAVAAGRETAARCGFAEAQQHYERALELWERVADAEPRAGLDRTGLLRHAAETANLAGEHGRAAELIRQAIGRVDERRERVQAGLLWERLGRFLWASGDSESALHAYERAVRLVPADPPSAARARVLAARGQALMLLARHADSRLCCEEAIAIARLTGARAEEGHALNTLGCDLAYQGDSSRSVAHLREALRIAEEVADVDDLFRAYLNLSDLLIGPLNQLAAGLELALEGVERSVRMGVAGDYGVSLQSNAAVALIESGRLAEAGDILVAAEQRDASEMAAVDLHWCWARLDVSRGRFGAATGHLRAARELMRRIVDPPYHAPLCAVEAELALWQGRPADARDSLADGLEKLNGVDDAWLAAPLLWLMAWAEADLVTTSPGRGGPERLARAEATAADLLARMRGLLSGAAFAPEVTRAYLRLGEAEATRLASAPGSGAWQDVAGLWKSLGRPLLAGYAHLRHAEVLLASRRTREGSAALAQAHQLAAQAGADPLRREAEALARRARLDEALAPSAAVPYRAVHDRHGSGLTPRQLEVLALIADGMTNREIARRLFITEKTAGAHVSGILAALGVRSRVEAATVAHRRGLIPAGWPDSTP